MHAYVSLYYISRKICRTVPFHSKRKKKKTQKISIEFWLQTCVPSWKTVEGEHGIRFTLKKTHKHTHSHSQAKAKAKAKAEAEANEFKFPFFTAVIC